MKLELGCGERPLEGYLHQDIKNISSIKLDFECQPYEIQLEPDSLDNVIALGVMEHLTEEQFDKTIVHMVKLLKENSEFLFDVPDMKYWFKYITDYIDGYSTPFKPEHLENTILGWRRFPGDEHKSLWWKEKLTERLHKLKYGIINDNYDLSLSPFEFYIDCKPDIFKQLNIERNRFNRWDTDRHLYVRIYKIKI